MSRLIDADALNKELQKRVGSPTDEKLYEANLCIIDAPTIDAIPMWWITEKFLDVLNKDKELSKAAWLVRKTWIAEQEAQDG